MSNKSSKEADCCGEHNNHTKIHNRSTVLLPCKHRSKTQMLLEKTQDKGKSVAEIGESS
jgi:hypothetical protein